MRPMFGQFTIRGFLLAIAVIASMTALLLFACDGRYWPYDPSKELATVAVVFGLPSTLGWLKARGAGADRGGAFLTAVGLHAALMAILCSVPPALWAYYILVRHGSMGWFTAWEQFHRTFEPSLALAILYGLACGFSLSAARRSEARPVDGEPPLLEVRASSRRL